MNLKNMTGVDDKAHLSDGRGGTKGADPMKNYPGPESHSAGNAAPGGRKMRSKDTSGPGPMSNRGQGSQ